MPDALHTDVLVIGGGLAGARAALAPAKAGAKTLLVSKAALGAGGASARASGGFAAAVGSNDSAELHVADTLTGGYGLNNRKLVETIAREVPRALRELNTDVGGFAEPGEPFIGSPVPMHSVARSVQYPYGMAQLMILLRTGLLKTGVEVLENHRVLDLIRRTDGRIGGASLYDADTGRVQSCLAGAVVLATGGCGQLFPVTSNGADATGDGFAIALRAGCTLRDMEFIQFTPTAFAAPAALKGQTIVGRLLSVDGVELLNAHGERFMARYAPELGERADRATLARAIFREVSEGRGTAAGGVYLDATKLSAGDFNQMRPGFYEACLEHGIDPCRDKLETAPAAHTSLGGVHVDERLQATTNLWVAGEALAGTHGANRLSSNSLSEALVTGWLAGEQAAAHAQSSAHKLAAPPALFKLPASGSTNMSDLKNQLRSIVGKAAGVERSANTLEAGLQQLAELQGIHERSAKSGVDDLGQWLDLRNMLLVAAAVLGSALRREESRGGHMRTDFPDQRDKIWLRHISCAGSAEELRFDLGPIV